MTYTAKADLDSLIADTGVQTLYLLCTVTWELHVQCFLHLNDFRHQFQDKMKWSLASFIKLTIFVQAVSRAQPDSLYWLYVCTESPA